MVAFTDSDEPSWETDCYTHKGPQTTKYSLQMATMKVKLEEGSEQAGTVVPWYPVTLPTP